MCPTLYWIDGQWDGRLAISGSPAWGDWLRSEIAGWKAAGVDAVVSFSTAEEEIELNLVRESDLLKGTGSIFMHYPFPTAEYRLLDRSSQPCCQVCEISSDEGRGCLSTVVKGAEGQA